MTKGKILFTRVYPTHEKASQAAYKRFPDFYHRITRVKGGWKLTIT